MSSKHTEYSHIHIIYKLLIQQILIYDESLNHNELCDTDVDVLLHILQLHSKHYNLRNLLIS